MNRIENNKLISIIVPVYKVEKYLARCIDSILNQTYTNFELILVDDGSPDNCPRICDEYAEKDKRIRVIHKQNAGVSEARNTGIDNAKGDFIAFVDSDDYIAIDYLKTLQSKQIVTNADLVFGSYFIVNSDNTIIKEQVEDLFDLCENRNYSLFFTGDNRVMGTICRILINKKILEHIRFEKDLKYCEDLYFVLNLLKTKCSASFVDKPIYYYMCNMESVTRRFTKETCYMYSDAVIKCLELLKNDLDNALRMSVQYETYLMACTQRVHINDKKCVNEFKIYNTYKCYRSYKKYHPYLKEKLRAFLCRYKLFGLLKLAYKLNDRIKNK